MNGRLTHTTQWVEKKGVIQDAYFAANPLFARLKKKGKVKLSGGAPGGTHEQVNLLYGENETFGWYKGYDVLNIDPQDKMGAAFFPWAQAHIAVSIDGISMLENAGPAKQKDLIQSKMTQAIMTIAQQFNSALLDASITGAETAANGKAIYSIPMLVDADVDRDRAIAGLNGLTYPWWRNNAVDYGATHTMAVFKRTLLHMKNTCSRQGNIGGPPDFYLMDQSSFENYVMSVEPQRRYTSSAETNAGFEDMNVLGAEITWDDGVQDAETNDGTSVAGSIYALNTNFLGLRVLAGNDWKWRGWMDVVDQDAKVNSCFWAGQLVTTNRRKHGVIYGVTKTAFTG
jgi:hypothetical protein